MVTNCSNNYGPYQHPEKLIPLMIKNALNNTALPIYGDGMNIRDWLYVDDHISALMLVIQKGEIGESYNIGSNSEKTNLEVVNLICDLISSFKPKYNLKSINYHNLIEFVEDRPGHDKRYAIDSSKIRRADGLLRKHLKVVLKKL